MNNKEQIKTEILFAKNTLKNIKSLSEIEKKEYRFRELLGLLNKFVSNININLVYTKRYLQDPLIQMHFDDAEQGFKECIENKMDRDFSDGIDSFETGVQEVLSLLEKEYEN